MTFFAESLRSESTLSALKLLHPRISMKHRKFSPQENEEGELPPPTERCKPKRLSLGDSVRNISRAVGEEKRHRQVLRLLKIYCIAVVFVLAVYAVVVVAVELGFNKGDKNNEKNFQTLNNPSKDIIKSTVPALQEYYRDLRDGGHLPLLPSPAEQQSATQFQFNAFDESSCVESFFGTLGAGVNHTAPAYVKLILEGFGLLQSTTVRRHLEDLLKNKQKLSSLYARSSECLRSNTAIEKIACDVNKQMRSSSIDPDLLEYEINMAVVLDALTEAMVKDLSLVSEISQVLVEHQEKKREAINAIDLTEDENEFLNHQYSVIAFALRERLNSLATNTQAEGAAKALQISILEAVKLDVLHGNDANARVGIVLAASVGFDPEFKEHRMEWALGKDWADAYLSWNVAFAMSMKSSPINLLIPSVVCSASQDDGKNFIHRHTLSLAASSLVSPIGTIDSDQLGDYIDPQKVMNIKNAYASLVINNGASNTREALAKSAGRNNLSHVFLTNPSQDRVEEILYSLCGKFCHGIDQWPISRTSPTDYINDEDYPVYITVIVWATAMMTGLGLEFAVWMVFLRRGWDKKRQASWKSVQFFFPLLAVMWFGLAVHQNYLSLLFLVVGLFKFGFPEILLHMYSAIYLQHMTKFDRVKHTLNGLGTALHHSCSILIISCLLTGVMKPYRFVYDSILILVVQHWFVLLKYIHDPSFIVIETVLEVWFEWSLVSQMEPIVYTFAWPTYTASCGMLVAHWFYFIAGFIGRFVNHEKSQEDMEQHHLSCVMRDAEDEGSPIDEHDGITNLDLSDLSPDVLGLSLAVREVKSKKKCLSFKASLPDSDQSEEGSVGYEDFLQMLEA